MSDYYISDHEFWRYLALVATANLELVDDPSGPAVELTASLRRVAGFDPPLAEPFPPRRHLELVR